IVDYRQRFQITGVGLHGYLLIAKQVSHALAHGHPFDLIFAVALDSLSNLEHFGIVDNGFDPKNQTGFVVHLEPVLLNTMFDPASRYAAGKIGNIGNDLPFKIAAQFASKKVHDLLGAKAQGAMAATAFSRQLSAISKNAGTEVTVEIWLTALN